MFNEAIKIIIIILAVIGVIISGYIRIKKVRKHEMVCPIGKSCDDVINSKYSKLFGIPVEILGLLYYGIIAVSYSLFIFNPEYTTFHTITITLAITITAFLFSIYSIFVQAILLKKWCMWCITSALLCAGIFFCSIMIL